jgi:hypothetical protein
VTLKLVMLSFWCAVAEPLSSNRHKPSRREVAPHPEERAAKLDVSDVARVQVFMEMEMP